MPKQLSFKLTYEVPAKIIYNVFLDQMEVMKFSRGKALVEPKVNGKFNIFDGKIIGTFLELDDVKFRIKKEWKFNDWQQFSIVEISIKDRDDECDITITQTNIPDNVDTENLQKGWMSQIFKPISLLCGYNLQD